MAGITKQKCNTEIIPYSPMPLKAKVFDMGMIDKKFLEQVNRGTKTLG